MPATTNSPFRILVLALLLTALTAISANAGWGLSITQTATDFSATAQQPIAPKTDPTLAKVMTTPLNAITAFDAALIDRYDRHFPPPLTADQLTVGDVNGGGSVTFYDGALVSYYVLGNSFAGSTGIITPSGLLMGDVSGTGPHYDGEPGTAAVSLPTMTNTGGQIVVPVTVGDLTDLGTISYEFQVTFDPTVLQPASEAADRTGTLGGWYWAAVYNPNNPGHLIVSGYNAEPLTGSGILINLVFNVVGAPGQSTSLTFENYTDPGGRIHQSFLFNEGAPSATTTNGSFTVSAFTPTPTFTPTNTATVTSTATSTPTPTVTATGTPAVPTLGNYPNTIVTLSDNATIAPFSPPMNAMSMTAETTTGFVGELTASPVTGVVRVTNARHANIATGSYPVIVRAFGVNGVMATSSFTLTVVNEIACAQDVLFVPPTVPQILIPNNSPEELAIGDFNNDGNQDVVTANIIDNASIRLGDGLGGFTSAPNVALGSRPTAIAVGDFNGDGNQDFAAANFFSNSISIRLGDGAGGFTLPVIPEITFGSYVYKVSVGDFNGDGKDDLAIVRDGNSISIRLGNGDSGFSTPSMPEPIFPGSVSAIAIGDFNNDGIQDLAATNYGNPVSNVSIRLGDGAGGFTLPSVPEMPLGRWSYALAIGDFNADGNQDFAATNADPSTVSNSVSIRLGNGNGGFVLPAIPEVTVGHDPSSIQIGDFDNDGIQDFAVSYDTGHSNMVSIRLGDGLGGFTSPTVPDVVFGEAFNVKGVEIGDFNSDGIQDLAAPVSGAFSIRLGACGIVTPTNTNTPTNTPTNTSTPTATATATPIVAVSLPSMTAEDGSSITVPVTVSDLTGLGVIAYDLQISFDPAVVQPASPAYDRVGTLSYNTTIFPNAAFPGHLIISAFQNSTVSGSGTLLNLKFNVVGTAGQSTSLRLEDYVDPISQLHWGAQLNEGDPSASITNGSVTVAAPNQVAISGTVTYGNQTSQSARPVPDVLVSGAGSIPVSALTDASGIYSLSGFGSGAYTITPSKTGDVNGSITSFDAAKIAQHIAGINILNPTQLLVADVSGSSNISSFDAAMIAKFIAGGPGSSGIGSTGIWQFSPAQRTHTSVLASLTNENYDALLMGDVSGNWTAMAASRPMGRNGPVRNAAVAAPRLTGKTNREILIPIVVRGAANNDVIAYEFDLQYEPSVIQPLTEAVELTGSVSSGLSVVSNSNEPGMLRVVVYGAVPIDSDGVLLNLRFVAVGKPGTMSPLRFERFMFNEGEPGVSTFDGQIRLSGPARTSAATD